MGDAPLQADGLPEVGVVGDAAPGLAHDGGAAQVLQWQVLEHEGQQVLVSQHRLARLNGVAAAAPGGPSGSCKGGQEGALQAGCWDAVAGGGAKQGQGLAGAGGERAAAGGATHGRRQAQGWR